MAAGHRFLECRVTHTPRDKHSWHCMKLAHCLPMHRRTSAALNTSCRLNLLTVPGTLQLAQHLDSHTLKAGFHTVKTSSYRLPRVTGPPWPWFWQYRTE